jgi:uncharacterized protein (TIGR00369 family)
VDRCEANVVPSSYEWGVSTRSRTFTWEDPARLAVSGRGLTGLDFIRRVADGELSPPPIAQLMGFSIAEVQEGRCVFALEPAEWMFNPIGSVHGGVAATLLDSCMGCAIHTTLSAGVGYTTTDLQVRYIRAMTATTGRVLAEGTVLHSGRRQVTAEGRITVEQTGKLVAHATTGCIVIEP